MTCGLCKFLDVRPDKAGRIVVRKANAYRCTATIPDLPPLPACVSVGNGFNQIRWPPSRSYMSSESGDGCAYFQQREKTNISAARATINKD